MADIIIKKAIELYIEEKPSNYFEPDLPRGFYGWGIVSELRKDENGVNYVVRYPKIFTKKEEVDTFIKPTDKVQRHIIEMYSDFTTYSDKNNPNNDYVVLTCSEKLKYKTHKHPNGRRSMQIKMPKKDRYQINYEEVFEYVYRFNKAIGMATPLDYHNHHYKEIPPLPQRMMDLIREKAIVRKLVIYGAALTAVFGIGKGIFTLVTNGDGEDIIRLDESVNNTDRMLHSNRSNYVSKMGTLAGHDKKSLSTNDKENTLKYVDSLIGANHDGNASLHRINLKNLLPRGDLSVQASRKLDTQSSLLEDIESKYDNCFCRPHAKDNNVAIDENHVPKFLNKAMPCVIFNSGVFEERGIATFPSNYESSNHEHPSGDEIRAFKGIPDIDKYIIACQAIEMYKRCSNYTFIHQAFPLNSDPLEALFKAKEEFRNRILYSNDVPQETKVNLLLDASDELMEKQAKSGK